MLIRFEVSNFRSIREPVELSMVAVDVDRSAVQEVSNIGESLVPVAGIYGPNASGKSNVLVAIDWLRMAVLSSLHIWDEAIPVEPFAFDDGGGATSFVAEFIVDGTRFEYIVELDETSVQYEALFHYPKKKRNRIFEREGRGLTLQRGLGHLSGTRELLTDRVLVLSIMRRFDEPLIDGFVRRLLGIRGLGLGPRRRSFKLMSHGIPSTLQMFEDPVQQSQQPLPGKEELASENRERALALLQMADLGIDDVLVEEEEIALRGSARQVRQRVRLVHSSGAKRIPLEFDQESEGTRTWFNLIGPVLLTLKTGSLLVCDELDVSLHPTLAAELIKMFADPESNPRGAQLVFAAHDTSLLNHLNRDEVWLTEKRHDGSTKLAGLAEFAGERVRKSQNLEKAYLHGRFGALPDVNRTELLHALGLIGLRWREEDRSPRA